MKVEKAGNKVVICGIGNPWRRDDGAGVAAARMLSNRFVTFLCETTPENFVDAICAEKPDTVIIIDSANFDGKPGEYRQLKPEEVENYTITTHIIPIPLIVKMIERCCHHIIIYGIQFKDISFGEELSEEVRQGVQELVKEIKRTFGGGITDGGTGRD